MAGGKNKKNKIKKKKTGGRGGMSTFLACLGGCGGKMPREDIDEVTELDFRHWSLTQVPPDVFASECTLETLYLDSNQLSELPRELFHCHGLRLLSVSDNELKCLPPAVAALTALDTLDVSKNNLSSIPDSIKSCRELRSVDASVNPLCRLPEGFTQLIALKELYLNDTFLEYLPANFGRLVNLEVLELRDNVLNTLPKSLARLTKLRSLDIGSNEFSQLPEVVGSLCSLQELWFDNNRVRFIDPFIGDLKNLMYVDGCGNRIDSLPDEIRNCSSLTDLHLSGNHLKVLPEGITECSGLQVLKLDDNALAELPNNIGALSKLTELVLTQNDLQVFPSSIGLLRQLHTLHADDNMLHSVPPEIGSCTSLSILTLASNRLEQLPPEVGHLNSLKVLNVWDNSIKHLPVSFSKLKLLALWLSDNQAKPSVQLQTETDPATGQKVLTCYMLPQQPAQHRDEVPSSKEEEPFPMANWDERHKARSLIKFSLDGDGEQQQKTGAKLSRAPTPYPKELRALAKHARNLTAVSKGSGGGATSEEGGGEEEGGGVVEGRRSSREQKREEEGEEESGGSSSMRRSRAEEVSIKDDRVTAEYQTAAALPPPNEFNSSEALVRTATKTTPDSVMTGPASPPPPSSPPPLDSAPLPRSTAPRATEEEDDDVSTPGGGDSSCDDDDTPAELLAEAFAVADHVDNAKTITTEDSLDRCSTDSGYGKPSHTSTASNNELSDRSSVLTSPVSSLPPETPSRTSSFSLPIAADRSSAVFSPATPTNGPVTPIPQECRPGSVIHSPNTSPFKVPPESPSPLGEAMSKANSNYLHSPVNGSLQPRPGSLALASLAESGLVSDRSGYMNRPGSLAAPCNTVGIPPAPLRGSVSASTGLNQVPPQKQQFSYRDTSTLYTIKQGTPTTPVATNATSPTFPLNNSSGSHYEQSNGTTIPPYNQAPTIGLSSPPIKYNTSSSRIPMSRLPSGSSMLPQPAANKMPIYSSSQLSNSKVESVVDNSSSRIPSLASAGRSYSNMSNSSSHDNGYDNGGVHHITFNGRPEASSSIRSPSAYKHTPAKESRLPNISSISTNGGSIKSNIPSYSARSAELSKMHQSPPSTNNTSPNVKSIASNSPYSRVDGGGSFGKSSIPPPSSGIVKPSIRAPSSYSSPPAKTLAAHNSRLPNPSSTRLPSPYATKTSSSSLYTRLDTSSAVPPTQQAINTSGLPPPPPSGDPRPRAIPAASRASAATGIPSSSSRLPYYSSPGAPDSSSSASNRPPSTDGSSQSPPAVKAQQQQQAWMFGTHQNARVFPVVIEKNPGPGFTFLRTRGPEKSVFISSVIANGPASSALKPGDKILQIDGETIRDVEEETFAALSEPNGDTITLLVSRPH